MPSAMPGEKQVLDVSGTEYPVNLHYEVKDGRVRVKLDQGSSIMDREEYLETPAAFSLVDAQDTTYSPPLPLVKFPSHFGETWTWKGSTSSYGKGSPSSALVTVGNESLKIGENVHNTVKIDVSLKLEGSPNSVSPTRHLVFWFEPGHGLLKRDFGGLSIRRPAW